MNNLTNHISSSQSQYQFPVTLKETDKAEQAKPADGAKSEGISKGRETAGDNVELASLQLKASDMASALSPEFSRFEATERATNDVLVHLIASDTPGVLSIWANVGTLPHALVPALGFFNMFNTATGVVSIALDSRETYKTVNNQKATKMDKIMDVTHLIAGDIVSTAASMVPLMAPLTSPAAMTLFVGGQLLGLGMDVAKSIYDAKRKGQQSAS